MYALLKLCLLPPGLKHGLLHKFNVLKRVKGRESKRVASPQSSLSDALSHLLNCRFSATFSPNANITINEIIKCNATVYSNIFALKICFLAVTPFRQFCLSSSASPNSAFQINF